VAAKIREDLDWLPARRSLRKSFGWSKTLRPNVRDGQKWRMARPRGWF